MSTADAISPSTILQVSNDAALAESRCLLLRSAGWSPETRSSQSFNPTDLSRCHVLLLCQTVSLQTLGAITRSIDACSQLRPAVVRIAWGSEATYDVRYTTLLAPVAPAELLDVIQRALAAGGRSTILLPRPSQALAQARALASALVEVSTGPPAAHNHSAWLG
ncbi:hypothetical protein GCM10022270_14740 [Terriglobus aquaticus]